MLGRDQLNQRQRSWTPSSTNPSGKMWTTIGCALRFSSSTFFGIHPAAAAGAAIISTGNLTITPTSLSRVYRVCCQVTRCSWPRMGLLPPLRPYPSGFSTTLFLLYRWWLLAVVRATTTRRVPVMWCTTAAIMTVPVPIVTCRRTTRRLTWCRGRRGLRGSLFSLSCSSLPSWATHWSRGSFSVSPPITCSLVHYLVYHSTYWLFSCRKDHDGSNCNRQMVT